MADRLPIEEARQMMRAGELERLKILPPGEVIKFPNEDGGTLQFGIRSLEFHQGEFIFTAKVMSSSVGPHTTTMPFLLTNHKGQMRRGRFVATFEVTKPNEEQDIEAVVEVLFPEPCPFEGEMKTIAEHDPADVQYMARLICEGAGGDPDKVTYGQPGWWFHVSNARGTLSIMAARGEKVTTRELPKGAQPNWPYEHQHDAAPRTPRTSAPDPRSQE